MKTKEERIKNAEAFASRILANSLKLAHIAGSNGAHVGACLSIVDILAVLYSEVLTIKPTDPLWKSRDRFILSKGHGSMSFYCALEAAGIISEEKMLSFSKNGSELPCTSHNYEELGMEFSNGTLGFGLTYAVGSALASARTNNPYHVYALLGDGECNEGSVWEAAMSATNFKLSNLTTIIDLNEMQSDGKTNEVMNINLEKMFQGFGWDVSCVDGHSITELFEALTRENVAGKPRAIIASTVKGKGISFMENNSEWHHNILSKELYDKAILEINDRI
jgi:transketolase